MGSLQLGLPYVLTEAGVARRYRGKRKLPDASYLLVPAVYEKMKERGMIYQEGPDLSWTIQFIPNGNCTPTYLHRKTHINRWMDGWTYERKDEHRHRHRHTDTDTQTQTHTHTHTHTYTHIHTLTNTDTHTLFLSETHINRRMDG